MEDMDVHFDEYHQLDHGPSFLITQTVNWKLGTLAITNVFLCSNNIHHTFTTLKRTTRPPPSITVDQLEIPNQIPNWMKELHRETEIGNTIFLNRQSTTHDLNKNAILWRHFIFTLQTRDHNVRRIQTNYYINIKRKWLCIFVELILPNFRPAGI